MSADKIKTGYVKRIFKNKGYGFIKNRSTKERIFFHASGCVAPKFEGLNYDMKVNYTELMDKAGRPIAIEIVEI